MSGELGRLRQFCGYHLFKEHMQPIYAGMKDSCLKHLIACVASFMSLVANESLITPTCSPCQHGRAIVSVLNEIQKQLRGSNRLALVPQRT